MDQRIFHCTSKWYNFIVIRNGLRVGSHGVNPLSCDTPTPHQNRSPEGAFFSFPSAIDPLSPTPLLKHLGGKSVRARPVHATGNTRRPMEHRAPRKKIELLARRAPGSSLGRKGGFHLLLAGHGLESHVAVRL